MVADLEDQRALQLIPHPAALEEPSMLADLRYALRALAASRGFSIAATLTLALGIGASTTIFTLVYGVLLKPLPFVEPNRLVRLTEGRPGFTLNVSHPNFIDWRARNHVFEDMAIFNTFATAVIPAESGPAEVFPAGHCEARLFSVLGVHAALGRVFIEADQQPSEDIAVVISDSLWRHRFGSDRSIAGRAVHIDETMVTIVGVLPRDVRPENVDVWFPMRGLGPMQLDRANHPGFGAIARLRRGIAVNDARREMTSIAAALEREYPVANHGMGVFVTPLLEALSARIRPTLTALSAAVNVLLLIACANVANLLLARGLGRERETSIRAALGATRVRLVRLFMVEGLVLGFAGTAAGLLIAGWGVRLLADMPVLALPRRPDIAVDPHVLAFAMVLAIVTALLFAFTPALHLSRIDLMRGVRLAGPTDTSTPRTMRLRAALVGIEVALLIVLLAGAVVMHRTLTFLAGTDPGFHSDGLLAVRLVQLPARYGDKGAIVSFAKRTIESLNGAGAIRGAALAWPFDYTSFTWAPNINLPERPFAPGREPVAQAAAVTPGYFETMGIPFVKGRNFAPEDRAGATIVVIVNRAFGDRFFPSEDPIGRRITGVRIPEMQNMPIVGVVGNTLRAGMLGGVTPEIYVSYYQFPQPGASLVVRSASRDPLAIGGEVKARLASIDPGVAISGIRRVSDQLAATYGDRRALSRLLGIFAMLALGLTIVGIGSVVSFAVVQRTREIGIRMALGAPASGVMRLVIRGVLAPVTCGAIVGVVLLGGLSGVARSYVFGVSPLDPASLVISLAVLLVAAVSAAYFPARRAAAVDPLRAMRRWSA